LGLFQGLGFQELVVGHVLGVHHFAILALYLLVLVQVVVSWEVQEGASVVQESDDLLSLVPSSLSVLLADVSLLKLFNFDSEVT